MDIPPMLPALGKSNKQKLSIHPPGLSK